MLCLVLQVLLLFLLCGNATKLPPIGFIADFAAKFEATAVNIHISGKEQGQAQHKRMLQRASGLPTAYLYQKLNFSVGGESSNKRVLDIFLPGDRNNIMDYFRSIFNSMKDISNVIWLLDITNFMEVDDFKDELSISQLDLDDDLYLFNRTESHIQILEAYRISPVFPVTMPNYGSWIEEGGLNCSTESKWIRRQDLQGLVLRTETMPSYPYISDLIPMENGFINATGLFFDIMDDLREILNFTYVVKTPPDNNWGSRNPDGTWNGMIHQLIANHTDIAVSDLVTTFARSQVVSFSIGIMESYYGVLIKNVAGKYNFLAYFEPLAFISWLAICTFCAILPPLLWLSITKPRKDVAHKEFTLSKCYIFVLSFLTQRGWSTEPSRLAARTSFISLVVGAFLLYQHWEAMLISYLSVRVTNLPFHNFPELLSKTDYKVIIPAGTAVEDFFRNSNDPVFKEVWTSRIKPFYMGYKTVHSITEHLATDSGLAAMEFFPVAGLLPEYLNCDIVAIPGAKILSTPAAMAFQKDSPYVRIFNFYLKEMRERGSLRKLLSSAEKERECPSQSGKPIGFDSCLSAFLVLMLGLISGLTLICIEHFLKPNKSEIVKQAQIKPDCDETSILSRMINQFLFMGNHEQLLLMATEVDKLSILIKNLKMENQRLMKE